MARRLRALVVVGAVAGLLMAGCSPGVTSATWAPGRPAGSAGPGVTPSATPGRTAAPARFDGALLYVPDPGTDGTATLALLSWAPGTPKPTKLAKLPVADALANVTVSPDGQRLAWVQSGSSQLGTLYVARLDGSGKKSLGKTEPYCVQPTWTSDGRHVLRSVDVDGVSGIGLVDVSTAAVTKLANPISGCHVVASGDGSTLAFADGEGRIELADPDGSNVRLVPGLGGDQGGPTRRRAFAPQSLSSDGHYIALPVHTGDMPDGDVVRALSANEIVDTTTGATMPLPIAGDLLQALFLPGGGVVVRVRTATDVQIALLSPDLVVQSQQAELPALATASLFGFVGAF